MYADQGAIAKFKVTCKIDHLLSEIEQCKTSCEGNLQRSSGEAPLVQLSVPNRSKSQTSKEGGNESK